MSRMSVLTTSTALAAWGCHAAYLTHRLRQSRRDPLTGLWRRDEFARRARRLLASSSENSSEAVLLLDLDEFKHINDTLGHEVGDVLLAATADRLRQALPDAVLGRLGGDEFVAVARYRPQLAAVETSLTRPVLHQHGVTTPAVSIGLAETTQHSTVSDALSRADAAMYAAKSNGRGTDRFDPNQHQPAHGRARQTTA